MWSGGVINIRDGRDLINVVFQYKHLNRIIARLEIFVLLEICTKKIRKFLL
jgi:hypothetical protein